MKKIFFSSCLIILFVVIIFGQAQVDIPITVKDQTNCELILNFGLDLTATDSIDFLLGEDYEACYHFPPPCEFFPTWFLPPFQGALYSCRDYRAPGNPPAFPFTGSIQYSIKFLSQNYPVIISWDLPVEISPTSTVQDIWGGSVINKSFCGNDSLVVTNTMINQLYVFVDYDNIVPVELTSFTASVLQNEKAVQLNWTTATETNNSGFAVERLPIENSKSEIRNLNWSEIGFIPGFGTTTETKSYSFTDESITSGVYKYRLKQIDFDGSFNYSNEIEVEVDFTPKEFVLYQNYPNPFNPKTVISYQLPVTGNVTLKVYDILGNEVATLVNEEKQPGVYEVEFDASPLASGLYLYKLQAGSFVQTKKMILLK